MNNINTNTSVCKGCKRNQTLNKIMLWTIIIEFLRRVGLNGTPKKLSIKSCAFILNLLSIIQMKCLKGMIIMSFQSGNRESLVKELLSPYLMMVSAHEQTFQIRVQTKYQINSICSELTFKFLYWYHVVGKNGN